MTGPVGRFPIGHLRAARLTGRRIALAGEAAHAMAPIGAQGLNLSLRDVASLAAILARANRAGEDLGSPARARSLRPAPVTSTCRPAPSASTVSTARCSTAACRATPCEDWASWRWRTSARSAASRCGRDSRRRLPSRVDAAEALRPSRGRARSGPVAHEGLRFGSARRPLSPGAPRLHRGCPHLSGARSRRAPPRCRAPSGGS